MQFPDRLMPNETLARGRELRSADGRHRLLMQNDGNLVLYWPEGPRWATGATSPGERLVMQGDGNLVVYNAANVATWQSGTAGNPGSWLALQHDGNLVVYDAAGKARWWIPPLPPTDTPPIGTDQIVTVEGIKVHRSIADAVGRMIRDARAAGIKLTGGGYRSAQQQIEVRRKNCGSSHYAIYDMPASQCSPPTARPGTSQHERGLAIDFDHMTSRSSPGFAWLRANAARYGFKNLPSEPWHWSTTGH
jgi:hypothetical protein